MTPTRAEYKQAIFYYCGKWENIIEQIAALKKESEFYKFATKGLCKQAIQEGVMTELELSLLLEETERYTESVAEEKDHA